MLAPPARDLEVLRRREHAGPQHDARLGRFAVLQEHAALGGAFRAAHGELREDRRLGERLDADARLLAAHLVDPAHHAEHPVAAALGLQREQRADAQPVSLQLRDDGAEPARAHVLDDPALRVLVVEVERVAPAEHLEHALIAVRHGQARLDRMALRFALGRLRRPVHDEVAQRLEHDLVLEAAAEVDLGRDLAAGQDALGKLAHGGERRSRAEEAQARARWWARLGLARRRHRLPQVGPVDQLRSRCIGEDEARRELRDHALGEIDLDRQQAVGRARAEHHAPQEFDLRRSLRALAVGSRLHLGELARLGERVDAVEHRPARQIDRAIAQVHPLHLLSEGAQRANEEHRQLRFRAVGALHVLHELVDRARIRQRGLLPVAVDRRPEPVLLEARRARRGEVLGRELAQPRLGAVIQREQQLQPRLRLEALGRRDRLQPVRQLVERLVGVVGRQRIQNALGLLGIGQRMRGFRAEQRHQIYSFEKSIA